MENNWWKHTHCLDGLPLPALAFEFLPSTVIKIAEEGEEEEDELGQSHPPYGTAAFSGGGQRPNKEHKAADEDVKLPYPTEGTKICIRND